MPDAATDAQDRRGGRVRSALFKTLLLLGSVSLCLVAAELGLRGVGFSYHLYPERVEFGWPDPSVMAAKYDPDPDLLWVPRKPVTYARLLEAARKVRPTVIFMGGSCTRWGSFARRFAVRVAEARDGVKPLVGNFAVVGWSSYQGLQQLKRDVLPLEPKVVVIYFGWNDHWIGFGVADKEVATLNKSLAYRLQSSRLVQLATKAYVSAGGVGRQAHPKRVSPEDFEHNLRAMVTLARERGIVPVLITAPSTHERLDDLDEVAHLKDRWIRRLEDLIPLHLQYVTIVRKVASSEGVVLCDLYEKFAAQPKEHVVKECFHGDGIHFLEAGDVLVARFLFECFTEHGLIDRILVDGTSGGPRATTTRTSARR